MKSKYKAIVSDFDGTIAGLNNTISLPVKRAITKWLETGNSFSIVTGKSFNSVIINVCKELDITSPQITDGGAEITDPTTHQILHSEYINEEKAKQVINTLQANKIDFMVRKDKKIFLHLLSSLKNDLKVLDSTDLSNLPDYKDIGKIRIFVNNNLGKTNDFLENNIYSNSEKLHIVRSDTINSQGFDITSDKANKKQAVEQLAKIINVSPKEMVAIGDGYNDINLFGVCGYHIAMGHAPQELQDLAEYVAPSIDEDGFAVAIETLLNES